MDIEMDFITQLKAILDSDLNVDPIVETYIYTSLIKGKFGPIFLDDRALEIKALKFMAEVLELVLHELDIEYQEKAKVRIEEINNLIVNKTVCLN